jgi:hypothetical protein
MTVPSTQFTETPDRTTHKRTGISGTTGSIKRYFFGSDASDGGYFAHVNPVKRRGELILMKSQDIRRNRDNVGERLGFLGRIVHGTNPRVWLKEMRRRLGEKAADFTSAVVG